MPNIENSPEATVCKAVRTSAAASQALRSAIKAIRTRTLGLVLLIVQAILPPLRASCPRCLGRRFVNLWVTKLR